MKEFIKTQAPNFHNFNFIFVNIELQINYFKKFHFSSNWFFILWAYFCQELRQIHEIQADIPNFLGCFIEPRGKSEISCVRRNWDRKRR